MALHQPDTWVTPNQTIFLSVKQGVLPSLTVTFPIYRKEINVNWSGEEGYFGHWDEVSLSSSKLFRSVSKA